MDRRCPTILAASRISWHPIPCSVRRGSQKDLPTRSHLAAHGRASTPTLESASWSAILVSRWARGPSYLTSSQARTRSSQLRVATSAYLPRAVDTRLVAMGRCCSHVYYPTTRMALAEPFSTCPGLLAQQPSASIR